MCCMSAPAGATSHRAERSFSAAWVLPRGQLDIRITAAGYGAFGQVIETLPAGFSYKGSDLSSSTAVEVEDQNVAFILLGDESFTYPVTAPAEMNTYPFSGIMLDFDKSETPVSGHTAIRVGPEPTPTPAPTPTPEPTASATPEPAATLTPTVPRTPARRRSHSSLRIPEAPSTGPRHGQVYVLPLAGYPCVEHNWCLWLVSRHPFLLNTVLSPRSPSARDT